MDQPHTPSEPPRRLSLTERLKAEANGHAPAAEEFTASLAASGASQELPLPLPAQRPERVTREEPTPSLMARRFAPEGHVIAPGPDPRPELRAPLEPLAPPQPRGTFGMQVLIVALILVALVPSAMLGGMIWSGLIATPWTTLSPAPHDAAPSGLEQTSVTATLGPATILPKQAVEVPAIALSAPDRLEGRAGQEVDFALALDGTDALPPRSIITVSGLPAGATFSEGRPYGQTEWTLRADEIGDLRLALPPRAASAATLAIQLVAPDGRVIADARTALSVAPDPQAALVQRPEEAALIADLIAHGNKMVSVGYFPGARAYFQRAVEAGSGEAALALGETYDPGFIARMGAQGIRPEPDQAIAWYERAKALGAAGADDRIAALKVAAKEAAEDSDAPAVAVAVAEQGTAAGGEGADATPAPDVVEGAAQAQGGTATGGAPELVVLTGSVNVRETPSPNAHTIRVMEQGTKLHAIGRKGGWVQVTDPATQETGWVYSRYVSTAAAAAAETAGQ